MIDQTRDVNRGGATRRALFGLPAVLAAVATALVVPLSGSALPQAPPTNEKPPAISGQAFAGEVLTTTNGEWSQQIVAFGYQWYRCDSTGGNCVPIANGRFQTYELQDDDVGRTIRVLVSASNAQSETGFSPLSAQTDVVQPGTGAPRLTTEPRITGSPVEGQQLTATPGTWSGRQPISFAFQWMRCGADGGLPDASNCTAISGATSTRYRLAAADVARRMRVRVTARNSLGQRTAASNPTAAVAPGKAPVNTKKPSVSGSWVEGASATVDRGTWTGASSYTYQWLRCNSSGGSCGGIAGATSTQYRLTSSDVGRKVRVNVTARNTAGSTTVLSTESGTVAAAGPAGVIVLPSGERSIPVTSVPRTERLIVDRVAFTPTPVRSRTQVISVQVRVKDTRGYVVRDAQVFIRSTPLVTRAEPSRRPTLTDGWVVFQMTPRSSFPQPRNGYNVQFFVKAYKTGDPALAGVAGYRLVQVPLSR
jgi:hypothetical protein